jgi:hypothetical protein
VLASGLSIVWTVNQTVTMTHYLTLPFFSPVLLQKSADFRFYRILQVLAEFACCWLLLVSKMPHPEENKMGGHLNDDVVVANIAFVASFDDLVDVLPNILEFLPPKDIMRQRRVCRKCREAATKTVVPLTDFCINSLEKCNVMGVMTRAMPNLQQITIYPLVYGHKYNDGEDPDEEQVARFSDLYTSHDIEIISNFSKLRILDIYDTLLNGRYPFLFNNFPLLQKLSINYCKYLKWDLEMLAGLPLLKELECSYNKCLTGNIDSLGVLKDTLEKVKIDNCDHVEGNFMDMADFPHLKVLDLFGTSVTGDIRNIGVNDFSSLEQLILPKRVFGGKGYELQRITDGPDLVRAVYLLNKQRPALIFEYWHGKLSEDSPDWYGPMRYYAPPPPFRIGCVQAGSRIGYQWGTGNGNPCEVNWLDPEPDKESGDYGKYTEDLQKIESRVNFYRGFHQPPTEEEYRRLDEEEVQRAQAEHRFMIHNLIDRYN